MSKLVPCMWFNGDAEEAAPDAFAGRVAAILEAGGDALVVAMAGTHQLFSFDPRTGALAEGPALLVAVDALLGIDLG